MCTCLGMQNVAVKCGSSNVKDILACLMWPQNDIFIVFVIKMKEKKPAICLFYLMSIIFCAKRVALRVGKKRHAP